MLDHHERYFGVTVYQPMPHARYTSPKAGSYTVSADAGIDPVRLRDDHDKGSKHTAVDGAATCKKTFLGWVRGLEDHSCSALILSKTPHRCSYLQWEKDPKQLTGVW